ncbi:MAG TPA: YqaA family protein [Hyphomicrobiales bacterium]|nr:YqaA family protein [Hyphomicrobiales bacterium]
MLRRLYDRVLELAAHRHAVWGLGVVSFVESSVFPIPPDVMLIPMTLAERRRAWFFAFLATVTSVIGGALGYLIGWGLFEAVGQPILQFYGYGGEFAEFAAEYNDYGAWIVLFAGVTPFPYKVITIASGVTGLSFPVFMAASALARGLRFFLVCGLIYWLGPPIRKFIEDRLGLVVTAFFVALFGGFLLIRYVF